MATLTYAPRGSSSYEQTRKAIFDAAVASGAVRVIEGYPVPILVVDRIASEVEQYYADQLLIDGRRLRDDVAFVEIAAHVSCTRNGTPETWAVTATFYDVFRGGYGNGRLLAERLFDSPPTAEAVKSALAEVVGMLDSFDYTSEWDLDARRAEGFRTLLGVFPALPSRVEYETTCTAHGLAPRQDVDMGYSAEHYDYRVGGFNKLEPIQQLAIELALRRGRAYLRERRAAEEAAKETVSSPAPAEPNAVLRCARCTNVGVAGHYPFSTAPSTGLCDDCL